MTTHMSFDPYQNEEVVAEVREQQIDPKKYNPKGRHPHLLEEWPVKSDLVVPLDALPENLKANMSAAWRQKQKNLKAIEEQSKKK